MCKVTVPTEHITLLLHYKTESVEVQLQCRETFADCSENHAKHNDKGRRINQNICTLNLVYTCIQ
jgi:hypothetical protein